jgi:hypothetical protein
MMGFTNNLNGEYALKMVQLDSHFASRNPNYLEDAMPSAREIHKRICGLIDEGKFDSIEATQLGRMYEGFKQYYLSQFI